MPAITKLLEKRASQKSKQVFLTEGNLKSFREAYASCDGPMFVFEGQPVLCSYAEYLLEYFEGAPVSKESTATWSYAEETPTPNAWAAYAEVVSKAKKYRRPEEHAAKEDACWEHMCKARKLDREKAYDWWDFVDSEDDPWTVK